MTVIRHNSISGIVSITAAAGSNLSFYDSTGATLSLDTGDINAGVITATTANFTNATVTGDLTVQGTTTTLDTTVTEVDKLEVGANNTTVGVAITQSGTGDILRLYDGASQVVTVKDGGNIGIGTDNPGAKTHIDGGTNNTPLVVEASQNNRSRLVFRNNQETGTQCTIELIDEDLRFNTNSGERMRILRDGNIGIGITNPTAKFELSTNNAGAVQNNVIRFTDTDASFQAGQSPGRIEWNTSDANSPGVTAYIDTYGYTNAVSDLVFGTGAGGSATERLRILHTGNIGIGTDAASNKVSILVPNETSLGSNSEGIKVWDAAKQLQLSRTGSSYSYGGVTGTGSLVYSYDKLSLHADTSNPITFATGGSESLRIDSNGNIGIGADSLDSLSARTSIGYQSLRVQNANITAAGGAYGIFGVNYYQHTDGVLKYIDAGYSGRIDMWGNYMSFNLSNGAAADDNISGSERMRIDGSGRLLIGRTASQNENIEGIGYANLVQIEGSATGQGLSVANNADAARINISRDIATGSITTNMPLGFISFGAESTTTVERARIQCDAEFSNANARGGRLRFFTCSNAGYIPTERMRLSNDGRFYLSNTWYNNITTANSANVHSVSNGEFYRSTSSVKYKTDIETIQDSYSDAILNIRPVWYRSLADADNSDHSWWGFIAEEVAEVDPRLVQWKTVDVAYDEKGSPVETPCDPEPEGVAYDRFVPHLLNLVKRQKEQIETQAASIAALEARLTALEGE